MNATKAQVRELTRAALLVTSWSGNWKRGLAKVPSGVKLGQIIGTQDQVAAALALQVIADVGMKTDDECTRNAMRIYYRALLTVTEPERGVEHLRCLHRQMTAELGRVNGRPVRYLIDGHDLRLIA